MSPLDKAPCKDGLSSSCFKSFPKWAKQAFAFRLIHTLFAPEITSKLPVILTKPLLYQGPVFPEGWTPSDPLPEGVFVDTEPLFPPDWQAGDPKPPGVIIPPETTFPPDWKPADPPPPGVIIPPGTTFPPDWNPPSPLPDTITSPPGAILPTGWQPGDFLPTDFNFVLESIFGPDWQMGDYWPESIYIFDPITLPADMVLTYGSTVSPGTIFPEDWRPADPLPLGVSLEYWAYFPPEWTPDDPLPPGVSLDLTASFPSDWSPGDPLPSGVTLQPGAYFPPGWSPIDTLPEGVVIDTKLFFPAFWHPGDPLPFGALIYPVLYGYKLRLGRYPPGPWYGTLRYGPRSRFYVKPTLGYYFYDYFDSLDLDVWELFEPSGGDITLDNGRLRFYSVAITTCSALHTVATTPTDNFNITFSLVYTLGYRYFWVTFYSGKYRIQIWFNHPDNVDLRDENGLQNISVNNFVNGTVLWKLEIRGDQVTLYQDEVQKGSTLTLQSYSNFPGKIALRMWDQTTVWIDDLKIEDGL
jgi:hypothetical protein